jgi:hypothetical protein
MQLLAFRTTQSNSYLPCLKAGGAAMKGAICGWVMGEGKGGRRKETEAAGGTRVSSSFSLHRRVHVMYLQLRLRDHFCLCAAAGKLASWMLAQCTIMYCCPLKPPPHNHNDDGHLNWQRVKINISELLLAGVVFQHVNPHTTA